MTTAIELARLEAEKKYRNQLYANERIAAFLTGYKFAEQALLAAERDLDKANGDVRSISFAHTLAEERAERAEAALKEMQDKMADMQADADDDGGHIQAMKASAAAIRALWPREDIELSALVKKHWSESNARVALMRERCADLVSASVAWDATSHDRLVTLAMAIRALPDPSPPAPHKDETIFVKVKDHIIEAHGCYPIGGPGESQQSQELRKALDLIELVLKPSPPSEKPT